MKKALLLLLVVLVPVLVFYFIKYQDSFSMGEMDDKTYNPSGKILMSLVATGSPDHISTHLLNVENQSIQRIADPADIISVFPSADKSQENLYFMGLANKSQVYVSPLTNNTINFINNKKLTQNDNNNKRGISVNQNGDILYYYTFVNNGTSTVQQVNNKSINLISKNEEKYIIQGIDPKWITETTFAYIAADGVYIYDLNTSKTTKVIDSTQGGEFLINSHIDVTNDGQKIALTNFDEGILSLYSLNSGKATHLATEKLDSFWPVFSPDGEYLAVQTADPENILTNPKPKLLIYKVDKDTLEKMDYEVDLSMYDQQRMFVNEWLK